MARIPSAASVQEAQIGPVGVARVPAATTINLGNLTDAAIKAAEVYNKIERDNDAVQVERGLTSAAVKFDELDSNTKSREGTTAEIIDYSAGEHTKIKNDIIKTFKSDRARLEMERRLEPLSRVYQKSALDYAQKAGFDNTDKSVRSTLSAFGNTIMRDPMQADAMAAQGQMSILLGAAGSPKIMREKLTADWAAAVPEYAIRGIIDRDPQEALRVLARGSLGEDGAMPFDKTISPERQAQLKKSAEVEINAKRIEETRQRIELDRAEAKARESVKDKFTVGILAPAEEQPAVTATEIARDKTLNAADKEHLITLMERRGALVEKKSQGATMENIVQQLAAGTLTADNVRNSNLPSVGDGSKEHFLGVLRTMERQGETAAQRKTKSEQQGTMENIVQKLAAGELKTEDITKSNLPPTGEGSKEHFLGVLRARAVAEKAGDETKYGPAHMAMWKRVNADDTDPARLRDERVLDDMLGNGLTTAGVLQLRSEMQNRRTIQGASESEMRKFFVEKVVIPTLSGANLFTGKNDPNGDAAVAKYMLFFTQEYQRRVAAGEKPATILDPTASDYIGKNLKDYKRSDFDFLRDIMKANPDISGARPREYKTEADVRKDYQDGLLTRQEATKILREKFGKK